MKLYDTLMSLSKDLLILDMKLLGETGYGKLKKAEIAGRLVKKLLSREMMSVLFALASPSELETFEETLQGAPVEVADPWDVLHLASFGYLVPVENGVDAPEDVKEQYLKLRTDDFYRGRDVFWPLIEYLDAFTSLYGIVPVDTALDIYTYYEGDYISKKALRSGIDVLSLRNNIFYVRDNIIFHKSMPPDEDVFELMRLQETKPFYRPPKSEVLKYANDWYYEKTNEYLATRSFLAQKLNISGDELEDLMDLLVYDMQEEADIDELMGMLSGRGIPFEDKQVYANAVMLITEQQNNTRRWVNRGFTAAELVKLHLKDSQAPSYANKRIGRNDPCPCGSGKKYKDCCGNILDLHGSKRS